MSTDRDLSSSTVAVLMTCHNRRDLTLRCLRSLAGQGAAHAELTVYLVDDGCTDGTAPAVRAEFPDVRIIAGTGDLFWSGGMRRAQQAALPSDPDYLLWLNDDVTLEAGAVTTLLATHRTLCSQGVPDSVVVGAMKEPETGTTTYSGVTRRSGLRRMRFTLVEPGCRPVPCETMHGNLVLVPRSVYQRLEPFDASYRHAMSDLDYGLRARSASCEVWITPPGTSARARGMRRIETCSMPTSRFASAPASWCRRRSTAARLAAFHLPARRVPLHRVVRFAVHPFPRPLSYLAAARAARRAVMSISGLLLLATAAVAGAELAFVFAARPRIAMVVAFAAEIADSQGWSVALHFGSLALTPMDLVCFALAAAIGVRVTMHWGKRPNPVVLGVLAICVLDLARGANQFGFQAAANEGRELFYFLVAAAFFSTMHVDARFVASFRRVLAASAVFLTGAACVFWAQRGFGTYAATGDRALGASSALLILAAVIVAIVMPFGRGKVRWLIPLAGFGVLVLSDQRTVAVSAVVAAGALYFLSARVGALKTRRVLSIILLIGGSVLVVALASGTGGADKSLTTAYSTSFSSQGTFSWRTAGWQQLIDRQIAGPIVDVVAGNPAGTGFTRSVDGSTFDLAPHSEYVTLFLTVGLVGLMALVYLFGSLLRRLARRARQTTTYLGVFALAMFGLIVAQLVFSVSYSVGMTGGVVLGVGLALVRTRPIVDGGPKTTATPVPPGETVPTAVMRRRRAVSANVS